MISKQEINKLQGPILVLGASGFIGANLLRSIYEYRDDVFGTAKELPAWRLEGVSAKNVIVADLLVDSNLKSLVDKIKPKTVFNCVAYGAYSFETDSQLIYETNFIFTTKLLSYLESCDIACYVHAGSSSEYGDNSAGPKESDLQKPNSDYSVSKIACANLLKYYGSRKNFPCANLRLYSVYGPMEDSSRLIPSIVRYGVRGMLPDFVDEDISRDFVYVEDVCRAFIDTAIKLKPENYGESFNVGTGRKTTIAEVADIAGELFRITDRPQFGMEKREWDVPNWFANIQKAKETLGWSAHKDFREGLKLTADWYRGLEDKEAYYRSSKKFKLDTKHSVSAILACYKDAQAIPIMYERLRNVFKKLGIDYEIIFVNDNSPDNTEDVIQAISRQDRKVVGISHSRNFGSQAAFRSGMEIATKNACVLLDGDLQDPPELIEEFVRKWREGYDVVYGRRKGRETTLIMHMAYKLFYRLFDCFSYLSIPHDAGDFSLMDKKVVSSLLRCPERDLFLRGLRAFVGFKQAGVDYIRPKRMFGKSTNSLLRNLGWAKKGILSFSYTPLNILSFFGGMFMIAAIFLAVLQIISKLLFPGLAPKGLTTVLLGILFFGSINIFALALLGEYIAKIFEEIKQRPHFIRRAIIKNGEIKTPSDISHNNT
ncbi:MAG: NAD-dependent epimerase/dehydratase family protein [Planctomycetota bacterium]